MGQVRLPGHRRLSDQPAGRGPFLNNSTGFVKGFDVSSLVPLGWTTFFQEQIGDERAGLQIARVVHEQRGLCAVAGEFDGWAEISGRFRHEAGRAADFPAVGDWVGVLAPPGAARAVIHRRFERRSTLSRKAAGRAVDEQVLAANVDTVFLVSALTHDVNPNRMERYLTMVWEGGAVPVVLLNKADLSKDPSPTAAAIRTRLPFVDVLVVSAKTADGTPVSRRTRAVSNGGVPGIVRCR